MFAHLTSWAPRFSVYCSQPQICFATQLFLLLLTTHSLHCRLPGNSLDCMALHWPQVLNVLYLLFAPSSLAQWRQLAHYLFVPHLLSIVMLTNSAAVSTVFIEPTKYQHFVLSTDLFFLLHLIPELLILLQQLSTQSQQLYLSNKHPLCSVVLTLGMLSL